MNPLAEAIETLGWANVWTYLALFLAASLLMVWRLEALLHHGLEGTALGTLVMPYCSGLGNLIFVALIASRGNSGHEVLTNCLVNNVTNLTLLLGLPALCWGLPLGARKAAGGANRKAAAKAETAGQLTRLSLLLTLAAVIFFSGVTWALAADGRLDALDGVVLIALFLFWQCFHVFDVLKHNVRQRRRFGSACERGETEVLCKIGGAGGAHGAVWLNAPHPIAVLEKHFGREARAGANVRNHTYGCESRIPAPVSYTHLFQSFGFGCNRKW